MCAASSKNFSIKTSSFPNAFLDSLCAKEIWSKSSEDDFTTLIPLPPPPQLALTITGYPILSTSSLRFFLFSLVTNTDGMVFTLASSATFFASVLFPSFFNIAWLGPIKIILFFSQCSANSGLSDKNP